MTTEKREALRAVQGRVYNTETFGTVDGPGVRYVLFLQGCPLRCLYCHNPDSINPAGGALQTAGEVVDEIIRYRNFIKGGVTISGGEPLLQPDFVCAVLALLHEQGLHTAIDTAGLPVAGKVKQAVDETNLLLLDIKAWNNEVCTRLTGRDNAFSFAMLDYCESVGKPVWVRHVLLRGYTLDNGQLEQLATKLAKYTCIEKVELLPFHKLGEPKWEGTGLTYTLGETESTTQTEAAAARAIFAAYGMQVQ